VVFGMRGERLAWQRPEGRVSPPQRSQTTPAAVQVHRYRIYGVWLVNKGGFDPLCAVLQQKMIFHYLGVGGTKTSFRANPRRGTPFGRMLFSAVSIDTAKCLEHESKLMSRCNEKNSKLSLMVFRHWCIFQYRKPTNAPKTLFLYYLR